MEYLPHELLLDGVEHAIGPVEPRSNCLTRREAAIVATAVTKRVNEFSTGRFLAKQVLATLGHRDAEILAGHRREPLWPPGVVGSISHSDDYALVMATSQPEIAGLGVDIEDHGALPDSLFPRILTEREQQHVGKTLDENLHWPTAVFSAKEALYKAVYPLIQEWIGFLDVELSPPDHSGTFVVHYRGKSTDIQTCIERASIRVAIAGTSVVSVCCVKRP